MSKSDATQLHLSSHGPVDEYEMEMRSASTREEMIDRFGSTKINTDCSVTMRQQRCHVVRIQRVRYRRIVPPPGKNKERGGKYEVRDDSLTVLES